MSEEKLFTKDCLAHVPSIYELQEVDLYCPECGKRHFDIDEWAVNNHKRHLCLHCGVIWEATDRRPSNPRFTEEYAKGLSVSYWMGFL